MVRPAGKAILAEKVDLSRGDYIARERCGILETKRIDSLQDTVFMQLPTETFTNARILILDDDSSGSQLLLQMFVSRGYANVRIINDARQAVAEFRQFRPDILVLDIFMPHLDGFEVMDQLRSIIPHEDYFPILALTGDESPETKIRALQVGAKDFLRKPLNPAEIIARICNLLETRFLHLELQSHNMFLEERVRERTSQLEDTLAQLRATQGHMIRQERLGALGVMASGIAHDFNNSLSAILGFGELLLEHPERREYLKEIMMAGQDARQTVRRLREFYRSEGSNEPFAAINLNTLAEQAISLTMPRWSNQSLAAGVGIVVRADLEEIPLIAGNPAELREAITNLIFNAVDALPNGGEIVVKSRTEGENAIISISDDGIGMDEQTISRCLEPFFTTKGERGTGLGLSMVHGIVRTHGGTVDIASTPFAGTVISLSFPATSQSLIGEEQSLTPNLERSLHILLVDDQPIICELVAELLRTDGHSVHTAGSGGRALEKLRQANYDLVITDLAMAGMSGDQLANVIKQIFPLQPIILLTGFASNNEVKIDTTNIDLVVEKPASLEDLRRAIFRVLAQEPTVTIAA